MTEGEYRRWWQQTWDWYRSTPQIEELVSRGEHVGRVIHSAVASEWMSQPPQERNIARTRSPAPPRAQGGGSANGPADDDIPFLWFLVPLLGALLGGGLV